MSDSTSRLLGRRIAFSRTRTVALNVSTLIERRGLHADSDARLLDAYRMLRTQVLQRLATRGWNSLAIVSCVAGEGRTTTAVNLASAIAADPEHAALLVDADLRSASVAPMFGIAATPDLVDCLTGEAEIADALVHPGVARLTLLPTRRYALSTELLASDRAERLFEELNARYADRVVVYDLPPLLACAEALTVLREVDAALLVVRDGTTRRDDLLHALELLGDTPLLGTVMNAGREVRVPEREETRR